MPEEMFTEEMFDVVDENDQVLEQLPRSVVHARGLLHRAVSIFVFNSAGELFLQKRTATKDEFPSCYTSSASGHVSAGETYDETAPRELQEELGIAAELEYLARFFEGAETANEHTWLYQTTTDQKLTLDPVEIESGEYRSLESIAAELDQFPERFTPPFRVVFRWYVDHHSHCSELGNP